MAKVVASQSLVYHYKHAEDRCCGHNRGEWWIEESVLNGVVTAVEKTRGALHVEPEHLKRGARSTHHALKVGSLRRQEKELAAHTTFKSFGYPEVNVWAERREGSENYPEKVLDICSAYIEKVSRIWEHAGRELGSDESER
jgi:hypothetical protein